MDASPAWNLIGVLAEQPVLIIFDNQSDNDVAIGNDGSNVWKTFQGGTALLLDMRANHGVADNMTFRKGMGLYARGAKATTQQWFRISYVYANPTLL
jgi:hypothetical protein